MPCRRTRPTSLRRLAPAPLLLLLLAVPAAAQPRPTRGAAEAAERAAAAAQKDAAVAAEAAAAAAAEEERLAERRVVLAREAQAAERRVAEAADRAESAAGEAAAARTEAAELAAALAPVLPIVHRLSLWPAETLLAAPVPPDEALRGLLVLQGLTRDVAQRAAAMGSAATRARDRARRAEADRRSLGAAEASAAAAAEALEAALAAARRQRAETSDAAAAAARRAAAGVARATSLRQALDRLEKEQARQEAAEARARARAEAAAKRSRSAAQASAPAAASAAAATAPLRASGGRAVPVVGRLLRGFGSAGEDGLPTRGLTWQAAPGARVVSPCAGRVAFAAPFRSYGRLVILDCGDRQHFVLAGLDRVDVQTGQRILAGEPVGQLGGGGARPTLYGELRRRGQPVDPTSWLRGG